MYALNFSDLLSLFLFSGGDRRNDVFLGGLTTINEPKSLSLPPPTPPSFLTHFFFIFLSYFFFLLRSALEGGGGEDECEFPVLKLLLLLLLSAARKIGGFEAGVGVWVPKRGPPKKK